MAALVEFVGGDQDWIWQRDAAEARAPAPTAAPARPAPGTADRGGEGRARSAAPVKLSFKEKRELEGLPGRIEALEAEIRSLEAQLASPDFYRNGAAAVTIAVNRLDTARADLESAYARWHALDEKG